jgi:phospholipid/cholesterol/gamma-HCH transport system permease protein
VTRADDHALWFFVFRYVIRPIARIGNNLLHSIAAIGVFTRFSWATIKGMFHLRSWLRRDRIMSQLYFVGTTSIPVLAITGSFIGMVLVIEGYYQFRSIGQENRLGGVINVSLIKQLGPVLAAVMVAGRVGCALTAELGSMRVTEQIDAMRAMAADPIRVLVCPRLGACLAMIVPLTVVSNLCGVFGGWVVMTKAFGADPDQYWYYSAQFVSWWEILNGLTKSLFFGGAIGLIACFKGFHCRPGAEGVGRATTESFVTSFLAIIALNLVLAKVLNDIDLWRYGGAIRSVFTG